MARHEFSPPADAANGAGGRTMFCPYLKATGNDIQGDHAEYMLMNADATYPIPDRISYEQAAPIFRARCTVYSGLRRVDPQPHERVAVLGIGGLGHLAAQYAKAAGFETIAISHSPKMDKMIRDLGADEIVRDGKSLSAAGGDDLQATAEAQLRQIPARRFDFLAAEWLRREGVRVCSCGTSVGSS